MKRSLQTSLAFALLLVGLFHADSFAYQKGKKPVQTVGVTGTYKYVLNTVEVLELPDHRVRISFSGFWPNDHKRVETRNVGTFDETVPLKRAHRDCEDQVRRRSMHNHAGIPFE